MVDTMSCMLSDMHGFIMKQWRDLENYLFMVTWSNKYGELMKITLPEVSEGEVVVSLNLTLDPKGEGWLVLIHKENNEDVCVLERTLVEEYEKLRV